MPAVPVQKDQTVFGQPAGSNYQSVPNNPDAFGAGVARGLGSVADSSNVIAMQSQSIANETEHAAAINALTASTSALQFDPKTGFQTLLGKDALDAYPDYRQQAQDSYDQIRAGLSNPAVQRQFDANAPRVLRYTLDSMGQHADQQQKVYAVGTAQAGIKLTQQNASNRFNDDGYFNDAINDVYGKSQGLAQLQGMGPEQTQQLIAKNVSNTWQQRIERYALNDPLKAQDLYNANADYIEPAAKVQLEAHLKSLVLPVQMHNLVQDVMSGTGGQVNGGQGYGAAPQSLHAAVQTVESGNDPNAISPKGAKGLMQVVDATNVDPGFGVRPAADNSAAERARVGNDYLDAMTARYNGNQTAALAAYNWGPANVDKLIASGVQPGSAQFTAALPAETQAYVAKVNALAPPQAGTPPTSTDPTTHLAQWEAQIRASAAAMYPGQPQYQDLAASALRAQVAQVNQVQDIQRGQSRDMLVSLAMGSPTTPNAPKPTSMQDLLSTPEARSAWADLKPEQQLGVMNLVEHNAKDTDVPYTRDAQSAYYQLKGMAVNSPVAFMNLNMMDYVNQLPRAMWHELVGLQSSVSKADVGDAALNKAVTSAQHDADPILDMIGVKRPTSSNSSGSGGGRNAAAYNEFSGRLQDQVDQFMQTNQRPPNKLETRAMIQGLTATVQVPGRWWGTNNVPAFALTPEQEATATVGMSDAQRSQLATKFASQYGRPPTDTEVAAVAIAQRLHPNDPGYLASLHQALIARTVTSGPTIALTGSSAQGGPALGPGGVALGVGLKALDGMNNVPGWPTPRSVLGGADNSRSSAPDIDVPTPPPEFLQGSFSGASKRNPAYDDWKQQYGSAWDAKMADDQRYEDAQRAMLADYNPYLQNKPPTGSVAAPPPAPVEAAQDGRVPDPPPKMLEQGIGGRSRANPAYADWQKQFGTAYAAQQAADAAANEQKMKGYNPYRQNRVAGG